MLDNTPVVLSCRDDDNIQTEGGLFVYFYFITVCIHSTLYRKFC